MVFDERLGILRSGNVISSEAEDKVKKVVYRLKERWKLALTEENGGRMVTHLAMALMRIDRGEEISSPADDILEEFRELDIYEASVEIVDDLIAWAPMNLPRAEKDYMIVNICLLLDK